MIISLRFERLRHQTRKESPRLGDKYGKTSLKPIFVAFIKQIPPVFQNLFFCEGGGSHANFVEGVVYDCQFS